LIVSGKRRIIPLGAKILSPPGGENPPQNLKGPFGQKKPPWGKKLPIPQSEDQKEELCATPLKRGDSWEKTPVERKNPPFSIYPGGGF